MVRRALISVYDKTGIVELAKALVAAGVEIVSTGATAAALKKAGVAVKDVAEVTGFAEIMNGRVKTLHPKIHGGLLAVRGNVEHEQEMQKHDILPFDLLVANFYPFEKAVNEKNETATIIENIDIGGPAMVRAAAKNFNSLSVLTSASDYESFLSELQKNKKISFATRQQLAAKAFSLVAHYDSAISNFFNSFVNEPSHFSFSMPLRANLRYGENPHQKAQVFGEGGIAGVKQIHGKELSFNNFNDTNAAFNLISEFNESAIAIIKHTNPCGVACDENLVNAYEKALACDSISAFGGIVACNKIIDLPTAKKIIETFTEIVLAAGFTKEALEVLRAKKNIRLLIVGQQNKKEFDVRSINGGVLVQELDVKKIMRENCFVKTKKQPSEQQWVDMLFAFRVAKHVKSNAIVFAKNCATTGIGAGQTSRVDSAKIASNKNRASNFIAASDAFFPFADGLQAIIKAGAQAIIQPGGSQNDDEIIKAADSAGIAMVFTGSRHFRH